MFRGLSLLSKALLFAGVVSSITLEYCTIISAVKTTPIGDLQHYFRDIDTNDCSGTATLSVLIDLPVDDNPHAVISWKTGSVGHSFLRIQQVLAQDTITKCFGLYPANGWKSFLCPLPVSAVLVDDSGRDADAAITIRLDIRQLRKLLRHVSQLYQIQYHLYSANCTDFAIDVFNTVSGELPVSGHTKTTIWGLSVSTPQALYTGITIHSQAIN